MTAQYIVCWLLIFCCCCLFVCCCLVVFRLIKTWWNSHWGHCRQHGLVTWRTWFSGMWSCCCNRSLGVGMAISLSGSQVMNSRCVHGFCMPSDKLLVGFCVPGCRHRFGTYLQQSGLQVHHLHAKHTVTCEPRWLLLFLVWMKVCTGCVSRLSLSRLSVPGLRGWRSPLHDFLLTFISFFLIKDVLMSNILVKIACEKTFNQKKTKISKKVMLFLYFCM